MRSRRDGCDRQGWCCGNWHRGGRLVRAARCDANERQRIAAWFDDGIAQHRLPFFLQNSLRHESEPVRAADGSAASSRSGCPGATARLLRASGGLKARCCSYTGPSRGAQQNRVPLAFGFCLAARFPASVAAADDVFGCTRSAAVSACKPPVVPAAAAAAAAAATGFCHTLCCPSPAPALPHRSAKEHIARSERCYQHWRGEGWGVGGSHSSGLSSSLALRQRVPTCTPAPGPPLPAQLQVRRLLWAGGAYHRAADDG